MNKKVIVLGGGNSPEREISLRSAAAAASAAKDAGFAVTVLDPKDGWSVLDGIPKDAVVLSMLHGIGGEDGEVQHELENRQLSFLGTGSVESDLAFDKWQTKQLLKGRGISVPNGELVTQDQYTNHPITQKPHVLKANRNGSSIGVYLVHDPSKIDRSKVDEVFRFGSLALLEEMIDGTEITVPILGINALPVIEIVPPTGEEFDYDNKYNGKTKEICPPINVSENLQAAAQKIAEQAHLALGCLHMSRTDIIIDDSGETFVLEVNTTPGMTDQSLYPKAALAAGISFKELVSRFVAMAGAQKRYT